MKKRVLCALTMLALLQLYAGNPIADGATCGPCETGLSYTIYVLGCAVGETHGSEVWYFNRCPSTGTYTTSLSGGNICKNTDPDDECANIHTVSAHKKQWVVTVSSCKNPCPATDPGTCTYTESTIGMHSISNQCGSDVTEVVQPVKVKCYTSQIA